MLMGDNLEEKLEKRDKEGYCSEIKNREKNAVKF